MSEPQTAAQGTDPPAAPPPAPVAADTQAPAPPAAPAPPPGDPNWLAPRLEQAKRSAAAEVLAQLGVKDAAEAKAALDAYKAAQEAQKTEAEKVAARIAEGDAAKARAAQLEAAVKAHAVLALAGLTEPQRAAVETLTAGDPARVIESIAALAPTWATAAQAAPSPVAPASTSPATPAPAGATSSITDHKAEYSRLRATNPVAAAEYRFAHMRELSSG
jgi:hypothetical protein